MRLAVEQQYELVVGSEPQQHSARAPMPPYALRFEACMCCSIAEPVGKVSFNAASEVVVAPPTRASHRPPAKALWRYVLNSLGRGITADWAGFEQPEQPGRDLIKENHVYEFGVAGQRPGEVQSPAGRKVQRHRSWKPAGTGRHVTGLADRDT
jgi:hypothetical protein